MWAFLSIVGVLAVIGGLVALGAWGRRELDEGRAFRHRAGSLLRQGGGWEGIRPGSELERILVERGVDPPPPRGDRNEAPGQRPGELDRAVVDRLGMVLDALVARIRPQPQQPADCIGGRQPETQTLWEFRLKTVRGQLVLNYPPDCPRAASRAAQAMRNTMANRNVRIPAPVTFEVSEDGSYALYQGRRLDPYAS